jgi:hypothetical protein
MSIDWKIWVFLGFLAVLSIGLLAEGVIRLRTGFGARWKVLGIAALAMVVCIGGNLGAYMLYSSNSTLLQTFKNPPGPSHLEPHWGASMSREDRTKYSEMLARTSFENWGITVNYFDETGTLRPYQATDADRARLQWRRQVVAHLEQTTELLGWITLGWLFIPWVGMGAAFVPVTMRALGALTGRSNADALQSGSAPLS